ncbi:MAG TPA: hypothetical protein VFG34_01230 [Sphingopyxis sp.]|nr:hypothetical protein [Sphingopyxis sp.]
MIVAVDSSTLTLMINPSARPPIDPSTGLPLLYAKERVETLIAGLSPDDTLIVGTPVLAEIIVQAGIAATDIISMIDEMARVKIVPFDRRAAFEVAFMTSAAIANGDKKAGVDQPWAKVKYDRQIIAIARVAGATKLYTDDIKMAQFSEKTGLDTFSTWELEIPEQVETLFSRAGVSIDHSDSDLSNVVALPDRKSES